MRLDAQFARWLLKSDPKNWVCLGCERELRYSQVTDRGLCGRCGDRVVLKAFLTRAR